MDEYFELSGQVFEWSVEKAQKNLTEHHVAFRSAATVFMDPSSVQFSDDEHSDEEVRSYLIGRDLNGSLLRVSFTEREPNIRIFSARSANDFDGKQHANGY
jgi:uncharacterized DUF497 family protein